VRPEERDAVQHAPEGFAFVPGSVRAGSAVFDVERAGTLFVCKRLTPRARAEGWMRERLAAEGRLLGRLGGQGAPRLVAAGEDGAGPWVVMAYVPWATLAMRVGRVEARWVERAARAAFEALAAVHAAGVVHGDIRPENVLASDDGSRAMLVDFGLARAADMPPMPPGPFRGTLAYAAPEVARSEPFDGRADVFSLAASLLHAASGEAPRATTSGPAMLLAAAEEPIEPWARRAAAELEPMLGASLIACCAFEATRRPERLGVA
jgi:eukaryotic-like serine/threonine-protein kinase